MTGGHVFREYEVVEDAKHVVTLLTGVESGSKDFLRQTSKVRAHFLVVFERLWTGTLRQEVDLLRKTLMKHSKNSDRDRTEYIKVVDRWMDKFARDGFCDFLVKPIDDQSRNHLFLAHIDRHDGGITKHRQDRQNGEDLKTAV